MTGRVCLLFALSYTINRGQGQGQVGKIPVGIQNVGFLLLFGDAKPQHQPFSSPKTYRHQPTALTNCVLMVLIRHRHSFIFEKLTQGKSKKLRNRPLLFESRTFNCMKSPHHSGVIGHQNALCTGATRKTINCFSSPSLKKEPFNQNSSLFHFTLQPASSRAHTRILILIQRVCFHHICLEVVITAPPPFSELKGSLGQKTCQKKKRSNSSQLKSSIGVI